MITPIQMMWRFYKVSYNFVLLLEICDLLCWTSFATVKPCLSATPLAHPPVITASNIWLLLYLFTYNLFSYTVQLEKLQGEVGDKEKILNSLLGNGS